MPKFNIKNIFSKIKTGDKKTLPVFIIGLFGIIIIFISSLGQSGEVEKNTDLTQITNTEYIELLEEKMLNILSDISGVGRVKIMITLENDGEKVYADAQKNDNETNMEYENGDVKKISEKNKNENSIVIIDGKSGKQVLTVTNTEPKIKGAVIVCEGGESDIIKEYITNAVRAALSLNSTQICVLPATGSK